MIYAEDEEVFRETAVRELLKLGFLRQDRMLAAVGGERWVTFSDLERPITGGRCQECKNIRKNWRTVVDVWIG